MHSRCRRGHRNLDLLPEDRGLEDETHVFSPGHDEARERSIHEMCPRNTVRRTDFLDVHRVTRLHAHSVIDFRRGADVATLRDHVNIVRSAHRAHRELRPDECPTGIAVDRRDGVSILKGDVEDGCATRIHLDTRRVDCAARVALRRHGDRSTTVSRDGAAIATTAATAAAREEDGKHCHGDQKGRHFFDVHEHLHERNLNIL